MLPNSCYCYCYCVQIAEQRKVLSSSSAQEQPTLAWEQLQRDFFQSCWKPNPPGYWRKINLDTFHKENLLIFLAPLPSGFLLHLNSLCFLIVHLNNGDDGGNDDGDDHNGDNIDDECGEKTLSFPILKCVLGVPDHTGTLSYNICLIISALYKYQSKKCHVFSTAWS